MSCTRTWLIWDSFAQLILQQRLHRYNINTNNNNNYYYYYYYYTVTTTTLLFVCAARAVKEPLRNCARTWLTWRRVYATRQVASRLAMRLSFTSLRCRLTFYHEATPSSPRTTKDSSPRSRSKTINKYSYNSRSLVIGWKSQFFSSISFSAFVSKAGVIPFNFLAAGCDGRLYDS